MQITGLDPASRLTGWATSSGQIPLAGVWPMRQCGDDLGMMVDIFDQYLSVHIDRFHPDVFVVEGPILVVNRGKRAPGRYSDTPEKLRKLYGLNSHIQFVCRRRGIVYQEETLQALKRELTGNPNASKDDMVAVARKIGVELPDGPGEEDAADATSACLIGLRKYVPQCSRSFDSLIYGQRRNALL